MPIIIFIVIVFLVFKLGFDNDIDYATTPYSKLTCDDVADAALKTSIKNGFGEVFLIERITNIERVSKDEDEIVCKATVSTDAEKDFQVFLTGSSDSLIPPYSPKLAKAVACA